MEGSTIISINDYEMLKKKAEKFDELTINVPTALIKQGWGLNSHIEFTNMEELEKMVRKKLEESFEYRIEHLVKKRIKDIQSEHELSLEKQILILEMQITELDKKNWQLGRELNKEKSKSFWKKLFSKS